MEDTRGGGGVTNLRMGTPMRTERRGSRLAPASAIESGNVSVIASNAPRRTASAVQPVTSTSREFPASPATAHLRYSVAGVGTPRATAARNREASSEFTRPRTGSGGSSDSGDVPPSPRRTIAPRKVSGDDAGGGGGTPKKPPTRRLSQLSVDTDTLNRQQTGAKNVSHMDRRASIRRNSISGDSSDSPARTPRRYSISRDRNDSFDATSSPRTAPRASGIRSSMKRPNETTEGRRVSMFDFGGEGPLTPRFGDGGGSERDMGVLLTGVTRNMEDYLIDDFDQQIFASNLVTEPIGNVHDMRDNLIHMREESTKEMQDTFKLHYSVFLRVINEVKGLHGKVSETGRQLEKLQQILRFRSNDHAAASPDRGDVDFGSTFSSPRTGQDNDVRADSNGNRDGGDNGMVLHPRRDAMSLGKWLDDNDTDRRGDSNDGSTRDWRGGDDATSTMDDGVSLTRLEDLLEDFEQSVCAHDVFKSAALAKELQHVLSATSKTTNMKQRQAVINEFMHAYSMFKASLVAATHDCANNPDSLKPIILSIVQLEGEHEAQHVLLESYSLWNLNILQAISRSRLSTSWNERAQTVILLMNSIVSIIAAGLEQAEKLLSSDNSSLCSYAFLWAKTEIAKGVESLKRLGPRAGLGKLADFVSIILKNVRWLEGKSRVSLLGVVNQTLQGTLRHAIIQTLRTGSISGANKAKIQALSHAISNGGPRVRTNSNSSISATFSALPHITVGDVVISIDRMSSSHAKQMHQTLERALVIIHLLDEKIDESSLLCSVPLIFCEIIEQRARGHIGVVDLEYGTATPTKRRNSKMESTAAAAAAAAAGGGPDDENAALAAPSPPPLTEVPEDTWSSRSAAALPPESSTSEENGVLQKGLESVIRSKSAPFAVTLRASSSDWLGLDILADIFELIRIILKFTGDRIQQSEDDGHSGAESCHACSSTTYRSADFRYLGKKLRHSFARLWACTLCEKSSLNLNANIYLVDVVDEPADHSKMETRNEQSQWTYEILYATIAIKDMVEQLPSVHKNEFAMIHLRFAIECIRIIATHELWNSLTYHSTTESGGLTFHDVSFMYLVHDIFVLKLVLTKLAERAMASVNSSRQSSNTILSTGSQAMHYEDTDVLTALDVTCRHILNKANSVYVTINLSAPDGEIEERAEKAAKLFVSERYAD